MKNKLNEAFDNIADEYIEKSAKPPKKSGFLKYSLVAAALALLVVSVTLVATMSRSPSETGENGTVDVTDSTTEPGKSGGIDGQSDGKEPGKGSTYGSLAKTPEASFLGHEDYGTVGGAGGSAGRLAPFFDLFYQKTLDGNGNSVVSPVNVYTLLCMLAECSEGSSREQILYALGAADISDLRKEAESVVSSVYHDNGKGKAVIGNSVWLSNRLPVNQSCVDTLNSKYYASVFEGSFADPLYKGEMKSWLSKQTGGLLDDKISDLDIPDDTAAALLSTLHFKAKWSHSFTLSHDGYFNGANGKTRVKYYTKVLSTVLLHEDGFTSYRETMSDGSRMWFFLPDEDKTVSDVLASNLVSYVTEKAGAGAPHDVTLNMPVFEVSCDANLICALGGLGITDFANENANFAPLTDEFMTVDRIQHAARVKVDYFGVEGAAYVSGLLTADDPWSPDSYEITLDRPFVFLIEYHGIPLFVGTVNNLR